MPRGRALPPAAQLVKMSQAGLTHAQIAEAISAKTGQKVSRSSVSAALSRAGLVTPKDRYNDTLPWRIAPEHDDDYHARMLRALGARLRGKDLDDKTAKKLDAWLDARRSTKTLVKYDPAKGFDLVEGAFESVPIAHDLDDAG